MRAGFFGICLGVLATVPHSQTIDLRGRVVRGAGDPVADVLVELKDRGASAVTGADGSFALYGKSSIGPGARRLASYTLNPHFLVVEALLPLEVRIEVVEGNGRLLGAFARRLGSGRHSLPLAEAVTELGRNARLVFLRVNLDGKIQTHPFFHSGAGIRGAVFAPAYVRRAAGKRAATVDTLRIRKAGYRELAVPITDYMAGDLGDLLLSESEEDGSICARQSMQRTSDGFDVVFCEALFDRPPRVRLPTLPESSTYAEMTSEAFVTEAGASYPLTARNSSDPEERRHASALYEIRIQDGMPESYRPAVLFAESLFLAPLMGKDFDGLISRRTEANRYELAPTLPVRVRIPTGRFDGEPGGESGFQAKAVIANLAASVPSADGICMPALSGYGSQAPFADGADVIITVGRVPSMHVFGDDKLVFTFYVGGVFSGNLMSSQWFFTPLDLVRGEPALSGVYAGQGHGAPGSIPILNLSPVSGGGEACPE